MYTSIPLFGLLFWPFRQRLKSLPLWAFALLLLPMIVDGGAHAVSDLAGIGSGFRDSNAWLAALTNHAFPAAFYAGDALESFNSWMRPSRLSAAQPHNGTISLCIPNQRPFPSSSWRPQPCTGQPGRRSSLLNLTCLSRQQPARQRKFPANFPEGPHNVVLIDVPQLQPGLVRRLTGRFPDSGLLFLVNDYSLEEIVPLLQAGATGFMRRDACVGDLARGLIAAGRGEIVLPPARLANAVLTSLLRRWQPYLSPAFSWTAGHISTARWTTLFSLPGTPSFIPVTPRWRPGFCGLPCKTCVTVKAGVKQFRQDMS